MKSRVLTVFLVSISLLFFNSCRTVSGFEGSADFCGLVTDSENRPVSGYQITLSGNGLFVGKAISNSGGVFVIKDVPMGNYSLSGEASFWGSVSNKSVHFFNRTEMFCLQVPSLNELLLACESALSCSDYQKAFCILENISDSDKEKDLILFYKAAVYFSEGKLNEAEKIMVKLKKKETKENDFLLEQNPIIRFSQLISRRISE